MIEEPKEPGEYWYRNSCKSDIVSKQDEYSYFILGDGDVLTWAEFVSLETPLAIEPVTPPSWERKTS